jgi:hypothetical protein
MTHEDARTRDRTSTGIRIEPETRPAYDPMAHGLRRFTVLERDIDSRDDLLAKEGVWT